MPRPPTLGEWPELRATINRVFRPGGGDLGAELPRLLHPRNLANLRVVTEALEPGALGAARILGHAGYAARRAWIHGREARVACIGAVFVVPEMRGQGIGSLLLEEVLRSARRDADLVLVSGDRGLYRRQGLLPPAPLVRFEPHPGPQSDSGSAARIRTREATADDIDRLIAMHDALDVRFDRSASDWRLWLAAAPLLFLGAPARVDLVEREPDGAPLAYTVTSLSGRSSGRSIVEYAGDRPAILDAAAASGAALWVPPYDGATLAEARARGWTSTPRAFPMTAEARVPNITTVPWYGLDYL